MKYLILICCLAAVTILHAQHDSLPFKQIEISAGPNYVLNVKANNAMQYQHFPGLETAISYKQRGENAFIFVAELYFRSNNGDPERIHEIDPTNDSISIIGNYRSYGINAGTEGRIINGKNSIYYGAGVGINIIELPEEIFFSFNEFAPPNMVQAYPQTVAGLNGKLFAGYEYTITKKMFLGLRVNGRVELPLSLYRTYKFYFSGGSSFESTTSQETLFVFYPQLVYGFRF